MLYTNTKYNFCLLVAYLNFACYVYLYTYNTNQTTSADYFYQFKFQTLVRYTAMVVLLLFQSATKCVLSSSNNHTTSTASPRVEEARIYVMKFLFFFFSFISFSIRKGIFQRLTQWYQTTIQICTQKSISNPFWLLSSA